jgi:hypothetical protein
MEYLYLFFKGLEGWQISAKLTYNFWISELFLLLVLSKPLFVKKGNLKYAEDGSFKGNKWTFICGKKSLVSTFKQIPSIWNKNLNYNIFLRGNCVKEVNRPGEWQLSKHRGRRNVKRESDNRRWPFWYPYEVSNYTEFISDSFYLSLFQN